MSARHGLFLRAAVGTLALLGLLNTVTFAQAPDHPVVTEVFTNPPGANDGPVGRDPTNPHQSYIEIYLPTAADLAAGLNKDALRVAFYEVEGDSSSSGNTLVNYRIDLPTFDLDSSNGLTAGAIARPTSGLVVIGWVDYVGAPPTDLAGTSATRVGLINGGITSASDFVFVAMNGGQFTGTTNFPVPPAISSIDLPNEASSGIIQNGSGAYLLVNRDDPGYVELYDDQSLPPGGSANPDLKSGGVLGVSALLDGLAGNDDDTFDVLLQPYIPIGIDLDQVLPNDGAFSFLIPQIAEEGQNGYLRRFVEVAKTTDDADPLNDDPAADAVNAYLKISNLGPMFPTPGTLPLTTSPPELSVADAARHHFNVLFGTIGCPEILCANVGGNFGMDVLATPGASSDPLNATFAVGGVATVLTGQTPFGANLFVPVPESAVDGAMVTAPVMVTASNTFGGDPAVLNPTAATAVTIHVIAPRLGQDALGMPFQATAFLAMQGLPDEPGVPNEFVNTSLAQFVAQHLGGLVDDERHNGLLLLDPLTNLSDPFLVDAMEDDLPDLPIFYINPPSPAGLDDLVTTIMNSAEVLSGSFDYLTTISSGFARAICLNIDETATSGGTFVPTELVHFVDADGALGAPDSGLTGVKASRGFELALLDTNVQEFGTLEAGETDDFGLIVEVGQTRAGAQVVPGEFVFLSFTGGLEGMDIETVDVPPHDNQTVIMYLDLELLDTILGCETITQLYVIDADGSNAINVIEAFSLNVVSICQADGDVNQDGNTDGKDLQPFIEQIFAPGDPSLVLAACAADLSRNGSVGMEDVPLMVDVLLGLPSQ